MEKYQTTYQPGTGERSHVYDQSQLKIISPEQSNDGQSLPAGKILNETVISREVLISKRVIREEIYEDPYMIQERIVEIAKPIQQEKVIEVPEIEYRDKIKEVIEKVYEEKVKEVAKVEYCERIIEVPKYVTQEKYVEVPVVEYRDVVTEKVIEIPEYHQSVIVKQVAVPSYIDDQGRPVQQPVVKVERKIPVPVEAVTTYEYQLAQFRPRVTKVQYPMYVPRFIPVPVHAEQIEAGKLEAMKDLSESLTKLVGPQASGLHEIEELQKKVQAADYVSQLPTKDEAQRMIRDKWLTGQLQVSVGSDQMVDTKLA